MTPQEAQYHVRQYLAVNLDARLAVDDRQCRGGPFAASLAHREGVSEAEAALALVEEDAELETERWAKAYHDRDWQQGVHLARVVAKERGLTLAEDSREFRNLCLTFVLAEAELHGARYARLNGNLTFNPLGASGTFPPIELPVVPVPVEPIEDAIKAYFDEKGRTTKLIYKTEKKLQRGLDLFARWAGPKTGIRTITRRHIGDFRSLLLKLPLNFVKKFEGMALEEIAAKADAEGLPRLKSNTSNGYLAAVSGFLEWCESSGRIEENPARGVRVETGHDEESYKPFERRHLDAIFRAPIFTGCLSDTYNFEPGTHRLWNWKYWVPLIGLFTGARIEEICQLRASDVQEIDGIWCFRFTEEGDRRLKTEAAVRVVPVHPELTRLGFVDFTKHRQSARADMLLPDPPARVKEKWAHYPSKRFAELLRRVLGAEEKGNRRYVFHSFRHAMKDAMREAEIEERIQDRLIGHKSDHVGERYGSGPKAPQLYRAIAKVILPVDLSHLEPWRPASSS